MKRLLLAASLFVLVVAAAASPAWAQKKSKFAPPATQAYVLPWIVTVALLLGGVSVVCIPSRRKRDVDVSGDDE